MVLAAVWGFDAYSTRAREEATEKFGRATAIGEADLVTDAQPIKPDEKVYAHSGRPGCIKSSWV